MVDLLGYVDHQEAVKIALGSGVRPVIDPNKPSRVNTDGVQGALVYVSDTPKQFLSETHDSLTTVDTMSIINQHSTAGGTTPAINSGQPSKDVFERGLGSADAETDFSTKYRPKVAPSADASGLKIEHNIAPSTLDSAYVDVKSLQSASTAKDAPAVASLPKSNQVLLDVKVQQLGTELQSKMASDSGGRNIVRDVHDFAISLRTYQNKLYNTRVAGFLPTTKEALSKYIESSENPRLKMLEKLPVAKPKHLAAAAEISKDERLLGTILSDTSQFGDEALKFLYAFREHPEVLSKYLVKVKK